MTFENFSGFVLAGGKSSRMKTDKAFLKIGGETFLSRAVKTLAPVCGERIKVILNRNQTAPENYEFIRDIFQERGALGGIQAALKNCETKFAVILAVDLPLVTSETIEKLAKITGSSNEFIATVPRQNDGRFQPLCAVYHAKECLPPLEKLMIENNSVSARDFLEMISPHFINQADLAVKKPDDIFFNINRPADFAALKNADK